MPNGLEAILFFSAFFALYFLLNFYVLGRLVHYLGLKRNRHFYIVLIFLAISFPASVSLVRIVNNFFTTALYLIGCTWLGILFISFFLILIGELVNLVWKNQKKKIGVVIIAISLSISFYAIINARFPEVRAETINFPANLKVVHLSDVHIGTVNGENYLRNIVEKTNELNPEVVLITGDLVDGSAKITKEMLSPLKELKAKVFFTTGNHEAYEGLSEVLPIIKDTGVELIDNSVVNFKDVQILGVSYDMTPGHLQKELAKLQLDPSKPSIFMYHEPRDYNIAADAGTDLMLSGHTHNGQLFPFNLFVLMVYPKIYGVYDIGDMILRVSSGTGTWGPPMRLGSNNEITFLDLKK